jgi:hypothetical protein
MGGRIEAARRFRRPPAPRRAFIPGVLVMDWSHGRNLLLSTICVSFRMVVRSNDSSFSG